MIDVISLMETVIHVHKFKTDKVGIGHEKIKFYLMLFLFAMPMNFQVN